jgi:hypothetical protein
MKRVLPLAVLFIAPLTNAASLSIRPLAHPFVVRVTQQGGGFSVDLPVVGHVRAATTTFSTSLDISNNTAQSTDVEFFFTPADGSAPHGGVLANLSGFDNLHFDDFLQALVSAGVMTSNQADNSFGTLLLTFTNPSFRSGTEATAVARILSPASPGGTYGLAYRARPIETNGPHSLSSVIRNGNGIVSNIGIENLGVDDRGNALTNGVTVRLSFFDPATGTIAGPQPTFTLAPGQVIQLNDVFRQFALPQSALLAFVDEVSGSGQIRGYVVLKDTMTNDGSFVFMQESTNSTF